MSNQDDFQFEGFEAPGTTPVPDIVFDELLSRLTGNELKVLLYIIRRTYGFGKNADAISLSQFREGIKTRDEEGNEKVLDKGCGIGHNRTILVALASLEKIGCVVSKKRNTNAGDSDTTIYKLRFKSGNKKASKAQSDNGVVTSGNHVVTPGNEGSYSKSPRWLPEVTTVVTSGNTQETVLQETVLQRDTNLRASIDDAILSFSQEKKHLEEQITSLKAQLHQYKQTLSSQATEVGGNTPPFDTRPTLAGGNQKEDTNVQIIHPEHSFIRLDDRYQPPVMIVTLTPAFPHPFYSEMEDKRRERIAAWEVLPVYKKQGLNVEVRWEHETERQTVDAATTAIVVVESTVVEGGNTQETPIDHNASSEPANRQKTGIAESQPVSVPTPSVEAPKTAVQTQETPSSTQAVESSTNQATEQGASYVSDHHSTGGNGPVVDSSKSDVPTLETAERQVQSVKQENGDSYSPPMATKTEGATKKPPAPPISITTRARSKKEATQLLTLQGSHIIELYEVFKKRKVTRNPANVKAANGLGEVVESDDDFHEVLTVMVNDTYLKQHNVRIDLDFVYRKYDGFLGTVDRLREEAERRRSGKRGNAPIASTPGSQYIVNDIDEVADSYIAAMEG